MEFADFLPKIAPKIHGNSSDKNAEVLSCAFGRASPPPQSDGDGEITSSNESRTWLPFVCAPNGRTRGPMLMRAGDWFVPNSRMRFAAAAAFLPRTRNLPGTAFLRQLLLKEKRGGLCSKKCHKRTLKSAWFRLVWERIYGKGLWWAYNLLCRKRWKCCVNNWKNLKIEV